MDGIDLKIVDTSPKPPGEIVCCQIGFTGKATGKAALSLTTADAAKIAASLLGTLAAEITDPVVIDDVIGEMGNMVVGNFKSNLCDAGLKCKLAPPVITRSRQAKARPPAGSLHDRIDFRAPNFELLAELNVDPWG